MRIIIAAIVGGIIAFGWGAVSWMALPFHEKAMNNIELSDAQLGPLYDFLEANGSGVYHHPGMPEGYMGGDEAVIEELDRRYEAGSFITKLIYRQEGRAVMPPENYAFGLATKIIAAGIAAMLLSCATGSVRSYPARVVFVAGFGVFAMMAAQAEYEVWFRSGWEYFLPNAADTVVAWALAAFFIAAIVKPRAIATTATIQS